MKKVPLHISLRALPMGKNFLHKGKKWVKMGKNGWVKISSTESSNANFFSSRREKAQCEVICW